MHQDFREFIWSQSRSKVWLIAGAHNQQPYRAELISNTTHFQVEAFNSQFPVYVHRNDKGDIFRILLLAMHPEAIFRPILEIIALRMDFQHTLPRRYLEGTVFEEAEADIAGLLAEIAEEEAV